MKIPRIFFVPAAIAALLVPSMALAQQAPAPAPPGAPPYSGSGWHGRHHGGFMRLMRNLNLTDTQKAQIKAAIQQFRQAHPPGSQPDRQAHQALRDRIMSILTPAQRTKLEQERAQHERTEQREPSPISTP